MSGKLPIPALLGGLVLLVIVFFLFSSNKLPQSSTNSSNSQSGPLLATDVLAMGGTCFTTPFIDAVDDVQVFPQGAKKNVPAPGKSEYDVQQIVIGRDGDDYIVQWDFVGDIPVHSNRADNHTNITLEISQDVEGQRDNATFVAIWNVSDNKWTTIHTAADAWDSVKKEFDPAKRYTYDGDVEKSGKSVRWKIRSALFSPNGKVDRLSFMTTIFAKLEQAVYTDGIPGPFLCPK